MDRSQIIMGLDSLHNKIHSAERLLKGNKLDAGFAELEALTRDATYYLKHIRALIKKGKRQKSLPFTGLAKRKRKSKTKSALKKTPTKRKRTVKKKKV